MTVQEELALLRKENQELREALQQTQELLRVALARIEELEKQKTPPPAFVKMSLARLQEVIDVPPSSSPRNHRTSHF